MKEIIKEYKEQMMYFLKNKKYIIPIIFVAILSYGFTITHYSIGIDDLCFDRYVQGTYILSAGRWGTWLLYNLLNITEFSPFWMEFIVSVVMVIFAIVICMFIRKQVGEKIKIWAYVIFTSVFISFPLINQFYLYQSTNLAVIISNLLIILSGIILYENYYKYNKKSLYIIVALLITLSISMYESCAQTYLVFIFMTIFIKAMNKENDIKKIFKYFIFSIVELVIGIVLFWLIGKIVMLVLSKMNILQKNYAYKKVIWLQDSFKNSTLENKYWVCICDIIKKIISTINVYSGVLLFFVISTITIVIELTQVLKNNKYIKLISVFGMILSNFILIFLQGKIMYRTGFSIIFTTAVFSGYIYWIFSNKSKFKILVNIIFVLLILMQTRTLNQYFYNDYKRYEKDKVVANQIGLDIVRNYDYKEKKIIYFIPKNTTENYFQINEDNGSSIYIWGFYGFEQYSVEITKFINNFGYNFENSTIEDYNNAKEKYDKIDMKSEEKSKPIIEIDNYIIINLQKYGLFL